MASKKINANPTVYAVDSSASKAYDVYDATDEESIEPLDAEEVFGKLLMRHLLCSSFFPIDMRC
jgi:hypothetical protein